MAIARIRKNDTVIVIRGNDAGKTGTVLSVNPKKGTPVRLSKLMPYDAESKRGTRVRTGEKEGKKARISVKSGKAL